ncbi:MAG: hypothetical protein LBB25_00195 [Holosporaceae bacterium]|jgi:hypothetical protein|nr:hypothetical protein [Holosporaceae bacterium]
MKKLIFLCVIVCTAVYVQGMGNQHALYDGERGTAGRPDHYPLHEEPSHGADARKNNDKRWQRTTTNYGWLKLKTLVMFSEELAKEKGCEPMGSVEQTQKKLALAWFETQKPGWLKKKVETYYQARRRQHVEEDPDGPLAAAYQAEDY